MYLHFFRQIERDFLLNDHCAIAHQCVLWWVFYLNLNVCLCFLKESKAFRFSIMRVGGLNKNKPEKGKSYPNLYNKKPLSSLEKKSVLPNEQIKGFLMSIVGIVGHFCCVVIIGIIYLLWNANFLEKKLKAQMIFCCLDQKHTQHQHRHYSAYLSK